MQCWHAGRRLILAGAVVATISIGNPADSSAEHPPRVPVARMPAVRTLVAPCDREGESPIQATPVRPYSYGYFGVKGGPQAHRHFGYYNNYRQWTFR